MHRCISVEESVNDSFNQKKERREMKMKISMNRTMSATFALFLMLTIAASLLTCLPAANAQVIAMPDRPTGSFVSVNPEVTGVNQDLTVNLWVYPSPNGPHGEGGVTNPLFFWNLTATFTR